MGAVPVRNDLGQYDELADEWWRPNGELAALHWLAAARARLVPPPARPDAVLLDVGCGGGLMAPYVRGYRHVGVDRNARALEVASAHQLMSVQADVGMLPVADDSCDVVVAGEIFEHVEDLESCVAEVGRVLRPGGTLVCDTINSTWWARFTLVIVGERMPGGPPRHIHDPSLFVAPKRLRELCARQGIELEVRGLRPSIRDYLAFLTSRQRPVRMLPTRSLSGVYQAWGKKVWT